MRKTLVPLGAVSDEVEAQKGERKKKLKSRHRTNESGEPDAEQRERPRRKSKHREDVVDVEYTDDSRMKPAKDKKIISMYEDAAESHGTELPDAQIEPEKVVKRRRKNRNREITEPDVQNEAPSVVILEPELVVEPTVEEPEKPRRKRRPRTIEEPEPSQEPQIPVSSTAVEEQKSEELTSKKSFRPRYSARKEDMADEYVNVVDELRNRSGSVKDLVHTPEVTQSIFDSPPPEPQTEEEPIQRVKTPILSSVYGSAYQKQMREQRMQEEQEQQKRVQQEEKEQVEEQVKEEQQIQEQHEEQIEEPVQKKKKKKRRDTRNKPEEVQPNNEDEEEKTSQIIEDDRSSETSLKKNNFLTGAIHDEDENGIQQSPSTSTPPPSTPPAPPSSTALDSFKLFLRKSRNLLATGRFIDYNQQPLISSQKHALFNKHNFVERKENVLMTVDVHKSDHFPLDSNIANPFIRVSVIDATTGLPLASSARKDDNANDFVVPIMTNVSTLLIFLILFSHIICAKRKH
jgi:hypothetical protein